MTPALRRKLEALSERHEEVGRLLAEPDASADPKRFRDLSREYAQLEPVALRLREYDAALRQAALEGDTDLTRAAERLFPATPGYHHPVARTDDADPAP